MRGLVQCVFVNGWTLLCAESTEWSVCEPQMWRLLLSVGRLLLQWDASFHGHENVQSDVRDWGSWMGAPLIIHDGSRIAFISYRKIQVTLPLRDIKLCHVLCRQVQRSQASTKRRVKKGTHLTSKHIFQSDAFTINNTKSH